MVVSDPFDVAQDRFRISGTTPGNSHPEKTPELSCFGFPAKGRRLAFFFRFTTKARRNGLAQIRL